MKPLLKLNLKEEVCNMCKEKINGLLATVTLLLISVSVCVLIPLDQSPKENPYLIIVLASAYGTILTLLIQIVTLLRKPDNNNEVIAVSIERDKIASISRIRSVSVIELCHEMYGMEYKAEYWPSYRCQLLAKRQKVYDRLVADGDKLFPKNAPCDKMYVTHLKLKEPDGTETHHIYRLGDMASEIEAAIQLLRGKNDDLFLFYSSRELAAWYYSLPAQKQTEWAKTVLRFLKEGAQYTL